VLTRPERLLALVLTGVVTAGLTSAATVRPAPAPAAAPAPVQRTTADPQGADPAPAVPAPAPPAPAPPPPPPPPAGPLPAPPEPPQAGCPVTSGPARPPAAPEVLPPPPVPDEALPAPLPVTRKAGDLSAVTGKGIWVTNWPTTTLDVPGLVQRAADAGLDSIWVRTGGSRQGWYGDRVLPQLVPAAHAAGLKVVAWDFPFLGDPVADAARAQLALDAGVDAIAPDIETEHEGTWATPRRIALYLSLVRAHAGGRPVAATVPRPTARRLATFPYAAFPAYADLFVPMVYWSCNEPGELVAQSMQHLGALLPVAPVGQGYDMGSEGGRHGLPTFGETWRFLDAARRAGAVGASLWTVEQAGPEQWRALAQYPWDAVSP
jgi:hypothetical protein